MQQIPLEGKTILVTGAAGFIGANLVKTLLEKQGKITVIGSPGGSAVFHHQSGCLYRIKSAWFL